MFVTFEGIDGAGKSTQVELLKAFLEERGRAVVLTREPGGTAFGEQVRKLLLDGFDICAGAEASLFAAARAELVERVIRPALERGSDVIVDRYLDSSLAYQGLARGLGFEAVHDWNLVMTRRILPDRTFVLSLPAEDASLRAKDPPDRMERESLVFRRRVEEAYRELGRRFPERIVELDASLGKERIAHLVRDHVRELLAAGAQPAERRAGAACS
jgi:dTMP kinase